MEKQPIRVTVFNQDYSLLAKSDPQEVIDTAQVVDDLMHAIAGKAPTGDSTRIAVLACMHLADKIRSLEKEIASLKNRTEEIGEFLEHAIGPE